MSVGFLAGLVVVCLNIFNKQQVEMINAIQEIEITSTVNDMRLALRGDEACTASFENKKIGSNDIKVIKKIIQYPETDEIEEVDAFPLFQYGRKTFGTHQLKITGFRLIETSTDKNSGERPLVLQVTFDKGLEDLDKKNIVTRDIKIYASTDSLGRIESCSLGKTIAKSDYFDVIGSQSVKLKGKVGIGTNLIPSKLSLKGALYFFPKREARCSPRDRGAMYFNSDSKELSICSGGESYTLSSPMVKGL